MPNSETITDYSYNNDHTCIIELRVLETVQQGSPQTSFLKFGDLVSIEIFDALSQSIFGSIEHQVVQYEVK